MMTKSNLKIAPSSESFRDLLQQIVTKTRELRDARRSERIRLNADAYMKEALRLAAATLPEIEALDQQLAALPPSPELEAAQRFVAGLAHLAADHHGSFVPPAGNFPYPLLGTTPEEVGSSCMELHVSRLELAAVAALRAIRTAPEIFAEGCDDAAQHEQYVATLGQEIEQLMQQAADALGLDDLLFTFGGVGAAHVSYALSKGAVPASGPGDPRGLPALIGWMEEHPAGVE